MWHDSLLRIVTEGNQVERRLQKDKGCLVRYDTIRYDSEYLTCSKKLTGSQLSLPHGTNKKIECETKNKMMSIIGPVQSRCSVILMCPLKVYPSGHTNV